MEEKVGDLLSFCSRIDFGAVNLSEEESEFSRELSHEILTLCRSLPESMQIDALLFSMRYLGASFSANLNFLSHFYAPAWSVVYWLMQCYSCAKRLEQIDITNAKIAHSMAMFLHSLDDHLSDAELPATHLTLLLRSQSWMIMNHAFYELADGVDGGKEAVHGFLDDYYSGICSSDAIESLDSYCDLFRKQMATWLIAPILIARKMTDDEVFVSSIRSAYEAFGIAWRLLDDIKDLKSDILKGVHSSIYLCVSQGIRNWWDESTEEKKDVNASYVRLILSYILENGVIERIKEKMRRELESAASIADSCDMAGLADEFRSLLEPLRNEQDHL